MELGKIPPHDIEAEQAILGSMLTDKDAVIAAIEVVKEEVISVYKDTTVDESLVKEEEEITYKDKKEKVRKELAKNGVDVTVDNRSEKIGYKIREARLAKLPYMLVVGEKEEAEGLVSVRSRFSGDEGQKTLDAFVEQICKEIRTKEIRKEEPQEQK